MTISADMNKQLNEQITCELFSAHLYLSMSCVLEKMGLRMLARWFGRQAEEERQHGMKIVHYLQEVDATVTLDTIPKPKSEFGTAQQIVSEALGHEHMITGKITDLVSLAEDQKDWATRSFLQWCVDEQVEEVASVSEVLNLVKLAGDAHVLEMEARVEKLLAATP